MIKFTGVLPKLSLAKRLNNAIYDLFTHGYSVGGFKFVARGSETAYLKVPGNPKGAVCVHSDNDGVENIIFYHPCLTGKEAWQLSATSKGCMRLADDEDMDCIRFDVSHSGWEYDVIDTVMSWFKYLGGKSPYGDKTNELAYM